jgi:quinol monooxygenase YgiN/quercetin dioxygenase-like cupin family protein
MRTWQTFLATALMTTGYAAVAADSALETAPDPVPVYPQNYKVLLENDRVRVVDFRLKKGATEKFHSHPANVAVFLETFKIRFTFPDGRIGIRDAHPGDVGYSGPVIHASENIGDTDAHGVLVELKQWPPAEAQLPPGAVTAVTLVHGIPGKDHELKEHLLSLAAPTRAEAGCIRYDLYQSPRASHEFMRYEVWASAAALEAHKQSPHLRASFEKRQREGWTTEILTWNRVPE